jgi:hypothetical protein
MDATLTFRVSLHHRLRPAMGQANPLAGFSLHGLVPHSWAVSKSHTKLAGQSVSTQHWAISKHPALGNQ